MLMIRRIMTTTMKMAQPFIFAVVVSLVAWDYWVCIGLRMCGWLSRMDVMRWMW